MLQDINAFFSHGQLCTLCVSAGTKGMSQMMDREKEVEISPGSSAEEAIWPVHKDLSSFGVDVVQ